MHLRRRSSTNI